MTDPPALRVLVVEDHPAVRRLVVRFLRSRGCTVTAAADGAEALDILDNLEVDVVLSDIEMPGLDGVSLRDRAITAQPFLQNRFVFMSSLPLPRAVAHLPHLLKPFELSRLWSIVREVADRGDRAGEQARP